MHDEELIGELQSSGQDHIVRHLGALPDEAAQRLRGQLGRFDYGLVRKLSALAGGGMQAGAAADVEPAPVVRASRPEREIEAAREIGEAAIRNGEVGAFLVAGGQGSRLQYDGPKGCYEIGPVSGKSLFQIHAEKVLASNRRYGAQVPFYIMTSETNDAAVRAFFDATGFFGLPPGDVFFCVQRMLPAFDMDGRFLLDAPGHVFVNPDGHGGSYFALLASGAFDDMARRGVRCLSYFQVDNPIVPAVDPVFIGEHVRTGSEMSSKVLRKREPMEKLGVFGAIGGELRVVEYSELTREQQEAALPDGSLKYAFGSIAIHVLDAAFARQMAEADLPFHMARKRISHLDEDGQLVEPESPNGIKFERFVFDGIPLANNPLVMEVLREEEFAPVKNFEGEDSPETARAAMMDQHRRWLRAARDDVPNDLVVEISPLFALDAAEVRRKAVDVELVNRLYLE